MTATELKIAQAKADEGYGYVVIPDGSEPLYIKTLETALSVARDYDKDNPTRILVWLPAWIKEQKKSIQ